MSLTFEDEIKINPYINYSSFNMAIILNIRFE